MKTLSLLLLGLIGATFASADDWPQWRGAQRDGVWRETGIVERIPDAGLAVKWQVKVGNGYSAPSVAQGRVFITDRVFDPELERVLCLDEATGKQLWMHSYSVDYKDMEYSNGPRAAPTVQDGKVYTLGTRGHLFCLDAATGAVVWSKVLEKDFNAPVPTYGVSAAPLVVGDLLIVCAGGAPEASVVALDRKTGELRWKALPDRVAYSAPIVIKAGGCEQLIVWTADSITSFDAPSGKVHWQVEWKATFSPAQMVATPVWHNDLLFCMGAWGRGSKMLKLDATKPAASVLWETRKDPTTTHTTPLFQNDGHIYAILGDGSLACLDPATGNKVWSTQEPTGKRMGNAHLVRNGDRVFLFNHSGHLILARLTPKGYEERGRCLLVEPTAGYRAQGALTWAHPAYANKCVFARNDRELVCVSLAADQNAAIAAAQPSVKSRTPAGFSTGCVTVAFSSDGKALAAGGSWAEGTKAIELATGKALPAPPPLKDFLCSVTYSPDGRWLVAAGGSEFTPARNGGKTTGQIKLFDIAAGKEHGELKGHTDKVFTAAFAPDSKTLATGAADNTVRLWDIATMKERLVLQGHTGAVMSVAFSPDGKTLASSSADHTVKLWDTSNGKQLATLKGHEDEVRAVAFAPDGKTLATGSTDKTVRLWDAATQKERAELRGHRGSINGLAFSPDGKTLATGSSDETIKLWDVANAKEQATLRGHRSSVTAIAFSLDARTLASAGMDDAVRLWDLTRDK
ncbi:PQQ-binding-like beta-propeller repeat protein [Prosthecobacter sp.]|uniref:outer membrane protein assembly factor BamB family protein n=1 Tax=Prosthecobacter sp. TaxID=1965333 RepID=UPI002AB849BE|nr:PQQ-binding-like beta-propeller repeat protein [Prosthecobacter sp.]MDZ4401394.1 PQQ-binding-like beta-propeller repeat protein [Prosthecobacter sp.]